MRATKIVATLGPATDATGVLDKLFEAGVDVFRMNASHGSWEQHAARMCAVRQTASACGSNAAILLDLQGPKIRLGEFPGGECELRTGDSFTITVEDVPGNCSVASCTYAQFPQEVRPNDRVLLADGAVELQAVSATPKAVAFRVVSGGRIGSHKGINLPGVKLSTPAMTKKDAEDLDRGLDAGIDFVALSFVRSCVATRRWWASRKCRTRRLPRKSPAPTTSAPECISP